MLHSGSSADWRLCRAVAQPLVVVSNYAWDMLPCDGIWVTPEAEAEPLACGVCARAGALRVCACCARAHAHRRAHVRPAGLCSAHARACARSQLATGRPSALRKAEPLSRLPQRAVVQRSAACCDAASPQATDCQVELLATREFSVGEFRQNPTSDLASLPELTLGVRHRRARARAGAAAHISGTGTVSGTDAVHFACERLRARSFVVPCRGVP
jgi:hypothetical protein